MKHTTLNIAAIALCLSFGMAAHADTMTKAEFKNAKEKIETEYKAALVPCDALAGNPKKICVTEAKGNKKVAMANLDASNEPSVKAQRKASDAKAEATYDLAHQKCQDQAGNAKDVCIKEAKAADVAAKADAKAMMKTKEANADARTTINKAATKASDKASDARNEAAVDKTDAQYKVEKEKCDTMAGAAKDNCLNQAKVRFGK
ncbi:MAG: hypothetical protein ABIZ09_17040 [Rhodoferax sp.]|jgi:hypothetical protein